MLYYLLWVASYMISLFASLETRTVQLLLYIVTTKLFCTLTNKYDDGDLLSIFCHKCDKL